VCQRHTKKALRGGWASPGERLIKLNEACGKDRSFSNPSILPDFRVESPVYEGGASGEVRNIQALHNNIAARIGVDIG
jgi:hypothetical protein